MSEGLDIGTLTGTVSIEDQVSERLELIIHKVKHFAEHFDGLIGGAAVATFAATAAITGMAVSIEEMAKKGSRIQGVEDAFDKLAEQAGTTGEALISGLSTGLQYTVDKYQLMQMSTRLLSSGFKANEEDMKLIGETAREMGKATGTDAADGLQTLNQALLTGQSRLLRRYGITIDVAKAEREHAAKLGITRDELTQVGKVEAARIAMLDGMRSRVDKLGESELSNAEKFKQGWTILTQWEDALAVAITKSPHVTAAIDALGAAFSRAFGGSGQSAQEIILKWVNRFSDAVAEYGPRIIQTIADIAHEVVHVWHEVQHAWDLVPDWFKRLAENAGLAAGAVYLTKGAIDSTAGADILGKLASLSSIWQVVGKNVTGAMNAVMEWSKLLVGGEFAAAGASLADGLGAVLATPVGWAVVITAGLYEIGKALTDTYARWKDGETMWDSLFKAKRGTLLGDFFRDQVPVNSKGQAIDDKGHLKGIIEGSHPFGITNLGIPQGDSQHLQADNARAAAEAEIDNEKIAKKAVERATTVAKALDEIRSLNLARDASGLDLELGNIQIQYDAEMRGVQERIDVANVEKNLTQQMVKEAGEDELNFTTKMQLRKEAAIKADQERENKISNDSFATIIKANTAVYEKQRQLSLTGTALEISNIEKQRDADIAALGVRYAKWAWFYDMVAKKITDQAEYEKEIAKQNGAQQNIAVDHQMALDRMQDDTLEERLKNEGVLTKVALAQQVALQQTKWEQMRRNGGYTAKQLSAQWDKVVEAAVAADVRLEVNWDNVSEHIKDDLRTFPRLLIEAFTGGGGLEGALKALGTKIYTNLITPIFQSLSKVGQAASGIASGVGGVLGGKAAGAAGGAFGAMAGGLGTAALIAGNVALGASTLGIGAAVIGVIGLIRHNKAISDARRQFADLEKVAETYGITSERAFKTGNLKDYQAEMEKIARLTAVTSQAMGDLSSTTDKYHFTDNARAADLYKTNKELLAAGLSQADIFRKTGADWRQLALDAHQFHTTLPTAIRSTLQDLVNNGSLSQALVDSLTFADNPLTKEFDSMKSAADVFAAAVKEFAGLPLTDADKIALGLMPSPAPGSAAAAGLHPGDPGYRLFPEYGGGPYTYDPRGQQPTGGGYDPDRETIPLPTGGSSSRAGGGTVIVQLNGRDIAEIVVPEMPGVIATYGLGSAA